MCCRPTTDELPPTVGSTSGRNRKFFFFKHQPSYGPNVLIYNYLACGSIRPCACADDLRTAFVVVERLVGLRVTGSGRPTTLLSCTCRVMNRLRNEIVGIRSVRRRALVKRYDRTVHEILHEPDDRDGLNGINTIIVRRYR